MRRGLALLASSLVLAIVPVPAGLAATAAKQPPPVAGVTIDGQRLGLADLRGKPVVVNVWSSW